MKKSLHAKPTTCLLAIATLMAFSELSSAEGLPEKILEFATIVPSNPQVVCTESTDASAPGLSIEVKPGESGYPGVILKPKENDGWDLSRFGHIETKITNTGAEPASVSLRVDNKSSSEAKPWNTESTLLKPGESKVLKVIFGYSHKYQPGYKLNPAAVSQLLLFTGKVSKESSFKLEPIKAAGPAGEIPPVDPNRVRSKPKDGFLLGGGVTIDPAKQIVCKEGAEVAAGPDRQTLKVAFSKAGQSVTVKAPEGLWDLREGYQIRFKLKNTGAAPATPSVRVDSKPGNTDKSVAAQALQPGATGEIVASFMPAARALIGAGDKPKAEPGTGTKFTSDAAVGVAIFGDDAGGAQSFEVDSIRLEAPSIEVPKWLGKRPPVDGDWAQTFNEDFDGEQIDLKRWNIYTSNFWDKRTHFSAKNVIVKNGMATLLCEKRTGRHNDAPNGKETPYATGFLDTYGKWVQRYGYFEVRMKLPKAPGMWPAFWLMPDRGLEAGEQWKRASTSNGGVEFDIMEFLSRWGPYRFSPAFHWDGYGKEHKVTGSMIYTAHDQDGYITTGLLWLPGLAVIYNNGVESVRWESPRVSNIPSDIMFTNVTGGWDNAPLDDAQLPSGLVIDYVRCWQRKDLASELDGVKSTQATPAAPTTADSAQP